MRDDVPADDASQTLVDDDLADDLADELAAKVADAPEPEPESESEVEPEPEPERRCLNCEAVLVGEYCFACGQRALPSRLALGELIREVLSETLEIDGRVWRTLVPFLFKPGFLTREYISGRRVRYSSPFRLFLAATLLWLATSFVADLARNSQLIRVDRPDDVSFVFPTPEAGEEGSAITDWFHARGQALGQLSQDELNHRFQTITRETLPSSALLTIPIFALLLKLLFIRQDRYYVEHLVFALHVHAFAFLVLAVSVLFEDDLVGVLGTLAVLGYTYVALWRAYAARWWTSVLRLITLTFVHGLTLALVTVLMVLVTLLMG